jgi:hypothetical protein
VSDAAEGAPIQATDGFAAYAVTTRSGPHVTMQAGVVHAGRFITTTSRDSLKARSVRTHRLAAATIDHDDGTAEIVSGTSVAVDLRHPEGMLTDPTAALVAGPAALRLAGDQLDQLLGYVEAAGRVPCGWLPHRRIMLATRIEHSLRLDGFEVVDGAGDWSRDRPAAIDVLLPTDQAAGDLPALPHEVAHLLRVDAPARIGLASAAGPVALPARWRGADRFDVSAAALAQLQPSLPGPGCATFDDSSSRRPDEKHGVMLRGDVALVDVDGPTATLALLAHRITAWDGFSTRTVDADQPAGTAGSR